MPESDKRTTSHLIFQLILSVHLMLSDIEVVSGVVVHRLHEAKNENIQDIVFQEKFGGSFKCQMCEQNGMDFKPNHCTPTHSSLKRYGSRSGGSGGEGGGSGGGGAPQGCWLLLPRVNICWKLMSV